MAGFALLGGSGGGGGLLPDFVKAAGDHPLWSQVVKYLIVAVIAYLTFRVVRIVFGTLKMGLDKHSLEIKKGILGVGVSRSIPRSKMTGLEQVTWSEAMRDSEGHSTWTQYWRLELKGDQSMTLLTNETSPDDTDWLGRYLAAWFEIPFVKKNAPKKR